MADIVMPRLSDTMEEGTILRWLAREGQEIERGEDLVEIETDKATMTYQADQDGVLELLAAEGDTLPIGAPIARVGAGVGATAAAAPPQAGEEDMGAAEERPPSAGVRSGARTDGGSPRAQGSAQAPAPGGAERGARVKASPLARRIAREGGIDLQALHGSGPGGRIVKADVVAVGQAAPAPPALSAPAHASAAPAPSLEGVATAKGQTTVVELSRAQQTVARRMAESKATIPDFSVQADVDMEACVALRAELKRLAHADGGPAVVPTYNDMVVKASALALREHPRANGSYRDGKAQLHSRVNVGVAVAAQDALIVPTVFDADEKSLGEIAREARTLAERVRSGAITPPELGGGTFTVSNLGMYGVRSFTAIVNPPQAAILSVGALAQRAVAHEGELAARHTMTLTLVCDHRILYGADAAEFLARIRELLQTPAALTL